MMERLRRFAGGLRALFRGKRIEQDLDEELRAYLETAAAEKVRAGLTPDEALRTARADMGSLVRVKEQVREAGWETSLESLGQDIRYGGRVVRRNPGFAFASILTLALGIGANTALFTVVNAVLLKPLPYPEPERLVTLAGGQSMPDVADLAEMSGSFEALGATARWDLDLVSAGDPERVAGELVAGDVFPALGVRPLLGRTFSGADDRALAPVAVVSHEFWRTHLASDPAALGRRLQLSGAIYTLAGVMPPGFRTPFSASRTDVWVPFRVGYPEAVGARGAHFMTAVGRLRDKATLVTTQSELDVLAKRIGALNPAEARTFVVGPLRERILGQVRTPLLVLLGAVGLVLLIACSNYASLLLARGVARSEEMRLRHALGASRGRLLRQLVTESALLSLLGGAVGVVLAVGGVDGLVRLKPAALPSFHRIAIEPTTLGFALLLSFATGVIFGLAPAWHVARARAQRPAAGATPAARSPFRRALVVSQLSLALVLLIGAGLLVRSFWLLRSEPTGFDAEGVLTLRLSLPASRYESIATQETFLRRLDEGLRTGPGIEASGLITELPFSGWRMMHNMIVEGQPLVPEGREPEVYTHEISPGYFSTMRMSLLLGRGFTDRDTSASPLVGVVNEAFVRRFAPDRDPLGLRARWARGEPAWMSVVGVVADVRFEALHEPQEPTIYTPYSQKQQPWKRWAAVVARGEPSSLAAAVRQQVRGLDAQLPITEVKTMTALVQDSVSDRRFNLVLLSTFAVLAFVLAALGVYGVLAHLVAQRSREVGVRMALGARRSDVLWLMLRQGLPLVAGGIVCGVLGALGVTRVLRSFLYGISTTDPATFLTAVATLAVVGSLATFIPARRATRVDPCLTLRAE